MAFVRSPGEANFKALEKHLAASLPEYMVPRVWQTVSSFPLTPNLKIDRKRLSELADKHRQGTFNLSIASSPTADWTEDTKRLLLLWK